MAELKVAEEVAKQEFERFAEAMDIDIDRDAMNSETLTLFEKHYRVCMRAMQKGSLVIDENARAVFTPTAGTHEPLVFGPAKGEVFMEGDKVKPGQNVKRLYATLGAWTGRNTSYFSGMDNRDLKVCEALFVIFFG